MMGYVKKYLIKAGMSKAGQLKRKRRTSDSFSESTRHIGGVMRNTYRYIKPALLDVICLLMKQTFICYISTLKDK